MTVNCVQKGAQDADPSFFAPHFPRGKPFPPLPNVYESVCLSSFVHARTGFEEAHYDMFAQFQMGLTAPWPMSACRKHAISP